jgi:ribosomal protein S18 acetylase RimI-like enzyme
MIEFLQLKNSPEIDRWAEEIAEDVFTTGPEYFTAVFGDPKVALCNLGSWIRNPNSEFSGTHVTLALELGRRVGAFIALPGGEVSKRRSVDTIHLLKNCKSERRLTLRNLLSAFAPVLLPVSDSDYYLRTLAVCVNHRNRGLGRVLLNEVIAQGSVAGYRRFRLDVSAGNLPAVKLYRSSGFNVIHEAEAQGYGHRTCAMLLER